MRLVDLIESGNDNDVDAIKDSYKTAEDHTDWQAVGSDIGNSIVSVMSGRGLELADREHLVGTVLKIFYPDIPQNASSVTKRSPISQLLSGVLLNSQLSESVMQFVNGINKG